MRIFTAGLFLLPFVARQLKRIKREDIKYAIASGFIGNAIPAILFAHAQTRVESSLSGALNSLTPLFTMLFSVMVFKIAVTSRQMIGVLVGLIGALCLIFVGSGGLQGETDYLFTLPIVLATSLYGLNVNLIKAKLSKYPPIVVTTIPLASVSIFALAVLLIVGLPEIDVINTPQGLKSLGLITTLGVVGTAFALVLFNRLLQVSSPVFAASVTYLIPIVALVVGFLDGEIILIGQVIGLVLILFGISLVNKRSSAADNR